MWCRSTSSRKLVVPLRPYTKIREEVAFLEHQQSIVETILNNISLQNNLSRLKTIKVFGQSAFSFFSEQPTTIPDQH